MRRWFLVFWLLLPVGAAAYHYGPGQERQALDGVSELIAKGAAATEAAERIAKEDGDFAATSSWAEADALYEEALDALPESQVATRRELRLERAKAQMFLSKLPEANDDLQRLVDEMSDDPAADAAVLADARSAYANSQYYVTWLMRLEGAGREAWEPEIEVARQTFKMLAEDARTAENDDALTRHQRDLEASIKLARVDLQELQGLPIPSQ